MPHIANKHLVGRPEVSKPRTKTVTLNFKRSELIDDARNYAFIAGDVMPEEAGHARHQVMDIGEDGNIDRVTRVLNLWMAKCREVLFPFTKDDVDDEEQRTDTLVEIEEYNIKMLVPDDFSKTTATYLEQLIHEFLVCRIMADWMSITNPASEDTWKKKADDAFAEIGRCKNRRTRKVRRKQHPFP